jgi:hypothetical protein
MEHVERRVQAHYGQQADEILGHLRSGEQRRYRQTSANVMEIPRGNDIFQRNLRALEYLAQGRGGANAEAVGQLYSDALEDLKSLYPPGLKSASPVGLYDVWKHVLDSTKADAERKIQRR